ncbi:hypothetical protein K437DRAFT_270085 [Tilletiaria anomala UBC 951]|uniref:K Homology domain-containing protein n=1 Tax=Tilletiaria anomala (strain ATCC 24038 / CBS 436.72 / UBC 951) TaxID=1037660 RepID=A0A066VEW9_TILAU|nr:uncharacterized protein K437DRAFT_270085 [Tilletiaria anomala UBC 951]KDN40006.1 hypothetical protein K437DRAFT_270085 [Tilletiaria anomala UBC 951]
MAAAPESASAADSGPSEPVSVASGEQTNGQDAFSLPAGPTSLNGEEGVQTEAPAVNVSLRALIVSSDASIIIGKQGKHINEIREKSGAKLAISQSIPGNPERIMSVSGPLDAVSKEFEFGQAFGLIVRRINDEPFDQPSLPGSRAFTIRFIVPNSRMGSVIGKQGTKIKEIQEESGALLRAGEAMLPGSTERMLSVSGVADAVHIAVFYVGAILAEGSDRMASNLAYRPGAAAYGAPAAGGATYGGAFGAPAPGGFAGAGIPIPGVGVGTGTRGIPSIGQGPPAAGSQTQQIYIPNDLVGSVIGKGGTKINEIRQASATHIKIMDDTNAPERLVTITGPPANIQLAVNLLHQRVEDERRRLQSATAQS